MEAQNPSEFEYNTSRGDIRITEYGRNIQNLLLRAAEMEDPEKQRRYVEKVIEMMIILNPQARNVEDYRSKLWKHAYRISGYTLRLTPPEGIVLSREEDQEAPEEVAYPAVENNFRHYGRHVQVLIRKAMELPEGPKRSGAALTIASYMKLACRTWNRENFTHDESIKNDLRALSKGVLHVEEGVSIDVFGQPPHLGTPKRPIQGKGFGGNDYGRNRPAYPHGPNKNKGRFRYGNQGPMKRKP